MVRSQLAAALLLGLQCLSGGAAAQVVDTRPGYVPRPPLLFAERWQLPPHEGEPDDLNMRFTPAVVTHPDLEVTLYGEDRAVVRAAEHENRIDLWTGMAASAVAITLRHRDFLLDLRTPARVAWMVRTNAIHTLYPVLRLADGQLVIGDRSIVTEGEFLRVEIAFSNMRWYTLDPAAVVVRTEVGAVDLSRIDEVGLATLAPGGGHGFSASANLSDVEVFAYPVPRAPAGSAPGGAR